VPSAHPGEENPLYRVEEYMENMYQCVSAI